MRYPSVILVSLLCLQSALASPKTWFVATNGLDTNIGTSNSPFATLMRAQTAAAAGDTVYLRGGTYYLDNSNFTATNNPWAIVNNINKSGISYLAFPGELPVFDFSQTDPSTNRETAFLVTANNCVFQGFDVVGVRVTIQTNHTQSECFRIAGGSFNRFEQLRMHDGMGIGWYLTDGASNLVLNCDAYNNRGLDSGSLGNIDGFGCHPGHTSGKGNLLRGCRAWFNSDDGFDCINAFALVTFDHCWAFYNGYFTNFTSSSGDGNGIKGGGYGISGGAYPTPIPHHVIEFCVAVRNRANGFYANHHLDGQVWYNNTAYRNTIDYNLLCNTNNSSGTNDVPGWDQVMKNNLGYKGSTEVANLDTNTSDVSYNFFTLGVSVTTNDFVSLDDRQLMAPRQADGSLPDLTFMELTNGSDCIDAGTNLGFAYYPAAPDLGAFETGPTNAPSPVLTRAGSNLIFTTRGWANRTNFLITATDLTVPLAQWTVMATNESDLAGICVFTNAVSAGTPRRFYGISLP
ncbi:MAG TPA: pectate lyase [Verrucomicrobiae bacterium]|nr:pectate lyase [Verrucomicrobiae bacterium]